MIFFHPTKKWIDWLIGYADNRIIVDIGCGEGLLLKELHKSGYDRLIGVNLYIRDELREYFRKTDRSIHLLEINTLENNILKKMVSPDGKTPLFLFCRPCHGWWVDLTLPNLPAGAEVLYVGKPGNLYDDIFKYNTDAKLIKSPPLKEEKVYRLTRKEHSSEI